MSAAADGGAAGRPVAGPARDAGQAFPLYVTAVAALLLLALAFFVVGRAGAVKNGAQTAADAAALAAAQDYREQLRAGFLAALGAGGDWAGWLAGTGAQTGPACRAAAAYAGLNDARPDIRCDPGEAPGSFTVTVTSARPVGRSVVPGTETRHAKATATAEVAPRCTAGPQPAPAPTPTAAPTRQPSPAPTGTPAPQPAQPVTLTCDDGPLVIDLQRAGAVVKATDLFTVHLAD